MRRAANGHALAALLAGILTPAMTGPAQAQADGGPRGKRAIAVCAEDLDQRYRAEITGGIDVRHNGTHRWVRGNAESAEAGLGFRFRCQTHYGRVLSLDFLAPATGLGASGSVWVPAPPPIDFEDAIDDGEARRIPAD